MSDPASCASRPWLRAAWGGIAVSASAILLLGLLQYLGPEHGPLRSHWGLDPARARHFADSLGLPTLAELDAGAFVAAFRVLLVLAWAGYGLALFAGLRGAAPRAGRLLPFLLFYAAALALLFPPTLSSDAYAYAAQARVWIFHGLNPYVNGPRTLVDEGDAVARLLSWNVPSMYGPVWMLMSAGLLAAQPGDSLWLQIVILKLVQAAALVLAALAGQRVAERLSPGRGDLVLLAIGLNPLFLLEGPGTGHNDLIMMALMVAAAWAYLEERSLLGGLCVGLAVAIKFVPLAVLPWIALEQSRGASRAGKLWSCASIPLLGLTPLILGFGPFWQGPETLEGLRFRSDFARTAEVPGPPVPDWIRELGLADAAGSLASVFLDQWPIAVLYLVLSVWLWRRPKPCGWLDAWVILSLAVNAWSAGVWFPWYLIWPWLPALLRWDKPHLYLSLTCFGLSLGLSWRYVILT